MVYGMGGEWAGPGGNTWSLAQIWDMESGRGRVETPGAQPNDLDNLRREGPGPGGDTWSSGPELIEKKGMVGFGRWHSHRP